jgi:hypothetical protein
VQASDAWIGAINMAQTAILLVGYQLWSREWRVRGARFVLLWTTLGLTLYPALTAFTQRVELIVVYAGLAGIFQAGVDLLASKGEIVSPQPQMPRAFWPSSASS